MFGTWAFIAACGVLIAGVTMHEKKKNERRNEQNQALSNDSNDTQTSTKMNIRRGLNSDTKDLVKSVNREFKCRISCNSVFLFDYPNYESEYSINGKKYVSYQTLQEQELGTSKEKYGCDCDKFSVFQDSYDNKVIGLIHKVPCFDSGDREYDQFHNLFLFHNGGQIYALYCGEGYRIAKLVLFENVIITGTRLKQYLRSQGFPI